ncbi:MAG TPA: hypothetical protein VNN08_06590 [Thermoanaerobaculia bacterium]|nr:hypothetical protein [Thermoanaerobaculia bacterium]
MEASFSFETALCQLFETEINPDHHGTTTQRAVDEILLFTAEHVANIGADFIPQGQLPPHLTSATNARLFHERLHWWQLASYPLMQLRFLLLLSQLRANIKAQGGNYQVIGGLAEFDEPEQFRHFARSREVADADLYWNALTPGMVTDFNCISEEPYTYQVFFYLPPNSVTREQRPAYGAALGFGKHHDIIHVAFTAQALLESAAYISQLLFEGQEPPIVESLDDPNLRVYLGPWEYWRRLHGAQYQDKRALAIAFLTAIDLAMMADIPKVEDSKQWDTEYFFERVSVPYRFGKLAYRLRGQEPLSLTNTKIQHAIRRYQQAACDWCGWPTPEIIAKQTAVFLTRALAYNCAFAMETTDDNRTIVEDLYRQPTEHFTKDAALLRPAWDLIQRTSARRYVIGQGLLEAMINACMLRTLRPTYLPESFVDAEPPKQVLPLPVILYNGDYYLDRIEPTLAVSPAEIFVVVHELARDSIHLVTLLPLQSHRKTCGFIEAHLDCYYQKAGFGCSYQQLEPREADARQRRHLDDYCHWTHLATRLEVAEPAIAQRWLSRWKARAQP